MSTGSIFFTDASVSRWETLLILAYTHAENYEGNTVLAMTEQ